MSGPGTREAVEIAMQQEPRGAVARPLLIELVGAAGAGKSTLAQALRRRDPGIEWLQRARTLRHAPDVALRLAAFAPTFVAALFQDPSFTWRNGRNYGRLEMLRRVTRRALARARGPVLLEHGPVHTLARIAAVNGRRVPPPALTQYASRSLARWAAMLDLVVFLDAPDDVLARRIRSRPKAHEVQHSAAPVVQDFLDRFDDAYRTVLADLRVAGGPPVLALQTDRAAAPELADTVLAAIERARHVS